MLVQLSTKQEILYNLSKILENRLRGGIVLSRELLQKYRKAVDEFCTIAKNLKEEELELALATGKWTIWEQIVHIVDVELVGAYRLRKILAEAKPLLLVFDQDAWVDKLDYTGFRPTDFADILKGMQKYNEVLIANLHPKQAERIGVHEEKGKITALDVATHHINHIQHHLDYIKKTLEKAALQAKLAAPAK